MSYTRVLKFTRMPIYQNGEWCGGEQSIVTSLAFEKLNMPNYPQLSGTILKMVRINTVDDQYVISAPTRDTEDVFVNRFKKTMNNLGCELVEDKKDWVDDKAEVLYCGMNPERSGTTLFEQMSGDNRFDIRNIGCQRQCNSYCNNGVFALIKDKGAIKGSVEENSEGAFLENLEKILGMDLSMYDQKSK